MVVVVVVIVIAAVVMDVVVVVVLLWLLWSCHVLWSVFRFVCCALCGSVACLWENWLR